MEFTTLVMTWKDKERKEKRKQEFLERLVRFKIATRVALALNIQTGLSINDQTQNVLRPIDKLFLTLIIKNRGGNTVDNLQKLIKVMVFITLLNKHQVGNTADNMEKLMKVTVFLTFLNRNGVYNTSDDLEGQGKKKKSRILRKIG